MGTLTSNLDLLVNGPKRPLLCLEVNPPRGVDLTSIFKRLDGAIPPVDFLNVTDCALAKMKMAALPFASLLKQRYGIEVLVNLACRDRNLIAIQSDLLAGWALGIRSVVALTGDAVTIGDSPERKGVFEVNSIGLLHAISVLNSGKDLAGHDLSGHPRFLPGVVVNPNVRNPEAEIRRLARKKEAGALYALSQPVFDEESSVQFFSRAQEVGIPIFMGLLAFRSAKAARAVTSIPGIRLSPALQGYLAQSGDRDLSQYFLEHCLTLARANLSYVSGFHVITGASAGLALELTKQLAQWTVSL